MQALFSDRSEQVVVAPDDYPLAFNTLHNTGKTHNENRRRHSHL
jgi:hypothetical protein